MAPSAKNSPIGGPGSQKLSTEIVAGWPQDSQAKVIITQLNLRKKLKEMTKCKTHSKFH